MASRVLCDCGAILRFRHSGHHFLKLVALKVEVLALIYSIQCGSGLIYGVVAMDVTKVSKKRSSLHLQR